MGIARLHFANLCDTHLRSSGGFPQRGAPADCRTAPVICFPLRRRLHKLSRKEIPVGSLHPFGSGQILNPCPPHYRTAFAFSDILYHAPPSARLTIRFPKGRDTGLPCSIQVPTGRSGSAFTPVAQHLRRRSYKPPFLATYLLVQACQHHLACSRNDA